GGLTHPGAAAGGDRRPAPPALPRTGDAGLARTAGILAQQGIPGGDQWCGTDRPGARSERRPDRAAEPGGVPSTPAPDRFRGPGRPRRRDTGPRRGDTVTDTTFGVLAREMPDSGRLVLA